MVPKQSCIYPLFNAVHVTFAAEWKTLDFFLEFEWVGYMGVFHPLVNLLCSASSELCPSKWKNGLQRADVFPPLLNDHKLKLWNLGQKSSIGISWSYEAYDKCDLYYILYIIMHRSLVIVIYLIKCIVHGIVKILLYGNSIDQSTM